MNRIITLSSLLLISFSSFAQNTRLTCDTLVFIQYGLGYHTEIKVFKNKYFKRIDAFLSGISDTTIYIGDHQLILLNRQIEKLKKIRTKDRLKRSRKGENGCASFCNITIIDAGNKKESGKYIASEYPPHVFKKIDRLIWSINNK